MNNNFWAPDVRSCDASIDISRPVDTHVERAMLMAYEKGLKDKEREINKNMHENNIIEEVIVE